MRSTWPEEDQSKRVQRRRSTLSVQRSTLPVQRRRSTLSAQRSVNSVSTEVGQLCQHRGQLCQLCEYRAVKVNSVSTEETVNSVSTEDTVNSVSTEVKVNSVEYRGDGQLCQHRALSTEVNSASTEETTSHRLNLPICEQCPYLSPDLYRCRVVKCSCCCRTMMCVVMVYAVGVPVCERSE